MPLDLDDRASVLAFTPDPALVHWIFGYGSIIFKQGFEHDGRCLEGYIKDYKRVFYQASTGEDTP